LQQSIDISYSNGFAAAGPFWDRQTDGRTVPITIGDLLRTTSPWVTGRRRQKADGGETTRLAE